MATSGPRYPGSAGGGWSSAGNVFADDGADASALASPSSVTVPMNATLFGFSIPADATIEGITVEIEAYRATTGGAAVSHRDTAQLLKAGSPVGTNKGNTAHDDSQPIATTATVYTYGGATDLWGTTWTPSEINASGFGFKFVAYSSYTGYRLHYIDFIRITVDYSEGGQPAVARARYVPGMRRPHGHQGW